MFLLIAGLFKIFSGARFIIYPQTSQLLWICFGSWRHLWSLDSHLGLIDFLHSVFNKYRAKQSWGEVFHNVGRLQLCGKSICLHQQMSFSPVSSYYSMDFILCNMQQSNMNSMCTGQIWYQMIWLCTVMKDVNLFMKCTWTVIIPVIHNEFFKAKNGEGGRFHGLTGSVVGHKSEPPGLKSRRGHVYGVFLHHSLHLITFVRQFSLLVSKNGRKMSLPWKFLGFLK